SASLSLNGLAEYPGQTAETKAMWLPSGDQRPVWAPVERFVIWRASPPCTSMIQSCVSAVRFDSKRTRLLFGLQRGWRSFLPAGGLVNCRGSPLSVGASQRLLVILLPARSTSPTT